MKTNLPRPHGQGIFFLSLTRVLWLTSTSLRSWFYAQKIKRIIIISILSLYLLFTSVILINNQNLNNLKSFIPFFQDQETLKRLDSEIKMDSDTNTIIITRILHNKINDYANTFLISIYRNIDLVTLFSLSAQSSMFESFGKIQLMYPVELLFLIFAIIYSLKFWQSVRCFIIYYLLPLITFSLFICGLFLPAINAYKIFPLILSIRIFIVYNFWKISQKWLN